MLDLITSYSRNLAVPARRNLDDPQVLAGKRVFYESGCVGCHRPKYVTRRDSIGAEQSFQLLWPYTDMLLPEIGRASCRDSVCQYVLIPVVAVALKNNKN